MSVARITVLAALALAACARARGCPYTVRDIGFIDLTGPQYTLFAVLGDDALGAAGAASRVAEGLFDSSNVTFGAVRAAVDPEHAAARAAGPVAPGRVCLVLIGADGRALPLGTLAASQAAGDAARETIAGVIASPARERIGTVLIDAFVTILLVEGDEEEDNARARGAIADAIRTLTVMEPQLPRPLAGRPVTLELARAEREAERVLLWSLGLDGEPGVALLYGRGKLAGRSLPLSRVTPHAVLEQLALVGEDCECDLGRDWVGLPSIPLRWDAALQRRSVTALGFDPDSPMVKAEVMRILQSRPRNLLRAQPADAAALLLGYSEYDVTPATGEAQAAEGAAFEPAAVRAPGSGEAPAGGVPQAMRSDGRGMPRTLWLGFGCVFALSAGGALWIILRQGGR